jgi:hypothetical protein
MAISEIDLPANWGVEGGPYDKTDEKINWFKSEGVTIQELLDAGWITNDEAPWFESKGLKRSNAPVVPANTVSAEDTAFLNRVSALASELKQPEFVIHDQFNRGLSENEIRAKYTPTADIAEQLIEASMSTGVSGTAPINFNRYGGYDKVLDKYLESGQTLSLASLTPEQLQSAATKVNETGVGNLSTLAITGTPISQTALNAMTKNGVDPATVAQIARDYSADNIKNTQTKVVQNLVNSTPNINTTDLFSKYVDQAKGYQGTLEGVPGVDFKGSTGLREAYGPYALDYLSRASALLGMRDIDPATNKAAFTGLKFGDADTARGGYGTETAKTLKDLQIQRENMMGMGTGANATPAYQPYQYSFTPKSAKSGGIMSLIEGYADGGMTGTQAVPSAFTAPTGTYQQATYNPTQTAGYVAPGTYQAGTIGSGFDATKVDTYTAPTGAKAITSTFAPSGLYDAGTIGSEFDINKTGVYTAPTGKDAIQSAYTTPTNMYTAGNIGSTYDPNTGLYSGPGTGITTETFDAEALQRLMSPYTSGVVDPQVREAKRQAEIARQAQAARMTRSGAFGGSRQAIAESELGRNLATQIGDIYGKGQQGAFDAALRAFEAEQGRKLQASTATETARQEAGRQALTGEQAKTGFSLQAQTAQEAARQAAGQQALSAAQTAGQLGLQAQTAQEAAKQAAGQQALSAAQTAGQLGLQAQTAQEAARQAAGQQALSAAQTAGQLGLQAQTAQEAAKQAAGQQALSAAQTAGQLGLEAQRAQEQAKQAAGQQALSAAQTAGQLGLQAQTAQEAARQAAGQQSLSAAEIAGRLGLQGSELTERSRQFAAQYGLQSAQSSAQYEQQARELQQRAEEAQARGDQFGASLALQQLQEAQRAAEASRAFEYQQARDTYLDPYRELGYASQLLQGLPVSAGATGISPATEAIISMLGLGNVLNVGNTTKTSDRRLKTDIQTIGVLDDGLKVYSYRYKSGGPVHIGVMADEVAVLRPQAYIKGGAGDGFDAVDYSKL